MKALSSYVAPFLFFRSILALGINFIYKFVQICVGLDNDNSNIEKYPEV